MSRHIAKPSDTTGERQDGAIAPLGYSRPSSPGSGRSARFPHSSGSRDHPEIRSKRDRQVAPLEKAETGHTETPGEKELELDCTLGEGPSAVGAVAETAMASDEAVKDVPPGMKGWICLLGVSLVWVRCGAVPV